MASVEPDISPSVPRPWDFLTNHAHVLLCVAGDPGIRQRDIALNVGITERATQRILSELVESSYLLREREGRRNHYTLMPGQPLRHPLVKNLKIGELIKVLGPGPPK